MNAEHGGLSPVLFFQSLPKKNKNYTIGLKTPPVVCLSAGVEVGAEHSPDIAFALFRIEPQPSRDAPLHKKKHLRTIDNVKNINYVTLYLSGFGS